MKVFLSLSVLCLFWGVALSQTCSDDVFNTQDSRCLIADFGSSSSTTLQGTILFCQEEAGNMTYEADLIINDNTAFGACTSGSNIEFAWHFHQERTNGRVPAFNGTACGGAVTGGHVDDTFACGPATDETVNCGLLNRTAADGYVYNCTPGSYRNDQYACELGDLSGKMGSLCVPSDGSSSVSVGRDNTAVDLELVEDKSLVLHCGGPRVACATLESTSYVNIDVPLDGSGDTGCSSDNDITSQYVPMCLESDFGDDTDNIVSGYVRFCQTASGNMTYDAEIAINNATEFAGCTTGGEVSLNWHFHQTATAGGVPGFNDDCTGTITGGHYDPILACGPASNEIGGDCVTIQRTAGQGYTYPCNPTDYDDDWLVCEPGDLSGKLGAFCLPNDGTATMFEGRDNNAPDLRLLEGRSLILHCGSPRKACATLNSVAFPTPSATPTPSPPSPATSPVSPVSFSPTDVSPASLATVNYAILLAAVLALLVL